MHIRRLASASALGILVAVGLSGCLKMDMQLELQSDNTVDGSMVFAVSAAAAEMLGQSPESFAEQLQEESVDLNADDVRTEPYDDGEFIGTTTYFEGQPLAEFDTSDDSMRIVREGDEFVVSGVLDMSAGGEDMGFGAADMDVNISVTFPGAVASHNGTLDGNTVSWTPEAGERLELNARGSAVEGGGLGVSLPLIIGIGVALLLVIGLILFFVLRSGRKGATAAPAAGYAPGTYPADPAQYQQPGYPQAGYPQAGTPQPGYPQQADTAQYPQQGDQPQTFQPAPSDAPSEGPAADAPPAERPTPPPGQSPPPPPPPPPAPNE